MKKPEKSILVHLAGIGICVFLVFGYGTAQVEQTAANVETSAQRISQINNNLKPAMKIRTEYNLVKAELTKRTTQVGGLRFDLATPVSDEGLRQTLVDLFKSSGLKIGKLEPNVTTKHSDFNCSKYAVRVKGNFRGLCKLLNRLDQQPRVIRFDQLDIESDEASDTYNIKATLSVYSEFNMAGRNSKLAQSSTPFAGGRRNE